MLALATSRFTKGLALNKVHAGRCSWQHCLCGRMLSQQQISEAAIVPTASLCTKANFELQQSSTPAFHELYLSTSAPSLSVMNDSCNWLFYFFLHRPH